MCARLLCRPNLYAALVALALAGCNKGQTPQAATTKPSGPPAVTVSIGHARSAELQRSIRITGSLAGLETAAISNRVTGLVSKIYVDRGDRVKPNEKLLEIEPERFALAEKEAVASLQQTLARLGLKEVPGEDFDVGQTAPVKKAQSEFDNANSKLERATPLYQSKVMKDFEYLDITSAYKTAESNLETSRDESRALLALARQNLTQIDLRKKDARDAVIVAPGGTTPDGMAIESYVVTDRKISAGEYLREGSALFTVMADGVLKLQARVPERYLSDIRKGAEVQFRVEAYPTEAFVGKVSTIDPAVDLASRTFLVEALVDNASYGLRLRPGSFVPGEVLTRKEPNRLVVPLDAVTSFVGVTKVYKIVDGKAKSVDVVTGQQVTLKDDAGKDAPWLEIVKGDLAPGDALATTGLTKLVDGSPVTADTGAAPATAPAAE
jgi:RND family efflux transporter MFP subunit